MGTLRRSGRWGEEGSDMILWGFETLGGGWGKGDGVVVYRLPT